MAKRTWSDEELVLAVKTSISVREVILKLGLKVSGNNYKVVAKRIIDLGLDTSHHKGQRWQEGIDPSNKRTTQDYLDNKYSIGSHTLKNRLIKEGVFEHKCYRCELVEWNGKPIPIELEHIDGNHFNNNLENLTILCPNCHAQTLTYRRRKST